jgi:hypothetical protein
MKIIKQYLIKYEGFWPIGSYAVVNASDAFNAFIIFRNKLEKEMPSLVSRNCVIADVVITELTLDMLEDCYIISYGDY